MPFVLNLASTITCTHGAKCTHMPTPPPRVLVSGAPVLTATDMNAVAGCPFTLPSGTPSPCVLVRWVAPAVRVKVMGQPVLLETSVGLGLAATQVPQGPAIAIAGQPRVQGL